jgi:hypothetical protein
MDVDDRGRNAGRLARSTVARVSVPTVKTVVRRRRRQRRTRAVGGGVAATIAVVVGTFAIGGPSPGSRGVQVSNPASSSTTENVRPSASLNAPAAGFLSAPIGTGVHTLQVWGWNGKRLRTVHTKDGATCCGGGDLSPDGTRLLLYGHFGKGGSFGSRLFDSEDRVIGDDPDVAGTWADDSRHMCALRSHDANQPADGPLDLILSDPGHSQRVVAQVPSSGPDMIPDIIRCSVVDDEAIVVTNTFPQPNGPTARMVRLSTGKISTPIWAGAPRDAEIVAISGDGRFVLEQSTSTASYEVEGDIVSAVTGRVLGHVNGMPSAISWNGRLVVTNGESGGFEVVDWRSGAAVWRSDPQATDVQLGAVAVRPASDDLAFTVATDPGPEHRIATLWLVTPSNPPRALDETVSTSLDVGGLG